VRHVLARCCWKIRDGVYVVTWREILIDLAAAFVYDMKACHSAGCAWGTAGGLPSRDTS
jgi:hypothetical protein